MMELRPTTDWRGLEDAVDAIARKASVGVTPESHADLLWVRLGNKELTPLAIFENGRRVGSLFYEVQRIPGQPKDSVLHISGCHMKGAGSGWVERLLPVLVELGGRLGCGKRVHFSSPRAGWARRAGARAGFRNIATSWLYEGGADG